MSDIKLFEIKYKSVNGRSGKSAIFEKPLKYLFEKNLEPFLGVNFLVTEYYTRKLKRGK